MIQDDPERRLKGPQLLSLSLFLISSFDKLYSAINLPTSCRSKLNIYIKLSLEIREDSNSKIASFSYLHTPLPSAFSYKYLQSQRQKGRPGRERF